MGFACRICLWKVGWPTGLEPATARTTIWGSTIELRPPSRWPLDFPRLFAKSKPPHACTTLQGRDRSRIIRRSGMNKFGLVLVPFILFCGPLRQVWAEEVDPSEVFLKAYMTAQQGERLERENQFQPALAKFRFAGAMLAERRGVLP